MEIIILFVLTILALPRLIFHIEIGMITIIIAGIFAFLAYIHGDEEDAAKRVVCIIIAVLLAIFSMTLGTFTISEIFHLLVDKVFG